MSNKRVDEYGGGLDGRLRAPLEVLEAVAAAIGSHVVLGIRVSADDFLDGGLHPEEMITMVERLQDVSPISYVHVSHSDAAAGGYSISTQIADMSFPDAPFRLFPSAFKAALSSLAVLAICRYDNRDLAAGMLESGGADFVGIVRGHIADPDIVNKWRTHEDANVRRCIACNDCISRVVESLTLSCTVNPEVGKESAFAALRSAPLCAPGHCSSRAEASLA